MIRADDFKLIVYPYAGVKRLFNLSVDPHEMNDLASDPAQKERLERMFGDLQELMVDMGDTLRLKDFKFVL